MRPKEIANFLMVYLLISPRARKMVSECKKMMPGEEKKFPLNPREMRLHQIQRYSLAITKFLNKKLLQTNNSFEASIYYDVSNQPKLLATHLLVVCKSK